MPIVPTYPGVYVEEISSGVRTITGVPTSVAAFIGRAQRGTTDKVTLINSFADYEATYGGLNLNSAMSFAVRDFFLNSGAQAVIGRLYQPLGGGTAKAVFNLGVLSLEAASEGEWANQLRIRVDHNVSPEVANAQNVNVNALFNFHIKDMATNNVEEHRNVTVVAGPRRLDNVLGNSSAFLRVANLDANRPADSGTPASGDPWTSAGNFTAVSTSAVADDVLTINNYNGPGMALAKNGIHMLKDADIFNLLCLPPEWNTIATPGYPAGLVAAASTLCEEERAILLLDAPGDWNNTAVAVAGMAAGVGTQSRNAAIFFPRLMQPNPLRDNQIETFAPCGTIAGVIARTDVQRGVWKAPAGIESNLRGTPQLSVNLTDAENGRLNPLGLNCLRNFPVIGRVSWGSRTLRGADILASEWKYLPVRRLALFIEETLFRNLKWVVFEPNDEPLWAEIRLSVGAFMHNLFRQGAFQGSTPKEAYLVKCDRESTTQNDIDRGIVNIVVGFAPLKPAEFVIIKIQQLAGQVEA